MQIKKYLHTLLLLSSTPVPGLTQVFLSNKKLGVIACGLPALAILVGNRFNVLLDRHSAIAFLIGFSALWLCLTLTSLLQVFVELIKSSKQQNLAWPRNKWTLVGIPCFWVVVLLWLVFNPALLLGADFYKIQGQSMWPTLQQGDWVIVDPSVHEAPEMGSIVIAKTGTMNYFLIKRVSPLPDGYPSTTSSVWLLGDNPDYSSDSRSFGSVPIAAIQGTVAWVWAP